jgi:hypothetical protein
VTVLSVSDAELKRLEVLRDVDRGGLPVGAAAQLMGRSERQVWRLLTSVFCVDKAGFGKQRRATRHRNQPVLYPW